MKMYRRVRRPGGSYFFTLVARHREPWLVDADALARLRQGFRRTMASRPFVMDAVVVLPDHLHAVWTLPDGDADFSTRWRLIKHFVSRGHARGRWQPRFWEHALRDDEDWRRHIDYIHYNPVKHGHADAPRAWPYSSFRRAVRRGWYAPDWGETPPAGLIETAGE